MIIEDWGLSGAWVLGIGIFLAGVIPIRPRLDGVSPYRKKPNRVLSRSEVQDFLGAGPGESEAGAAVSVIVNDRAAIWQFVRLDANAAAAAGPQADTVAQQRAV